MGWRQQDCWLQRASPSVEHSLRVQGILPAAGGSWAKGKAVLILFLTGGDSFFRLCPQVHLSVDLGFLSRAKGSSVPNCRAA